MPMYNIFMTTLACKKEFVVKEGECYDGIYFLHFTVALFGIISLLVLSTTGTLIYIDLNPNSTIPFASP